MVDQDLFKKKYLINGGDFTAAGEASVEIKNILKDIGFDPDVIRRLAIASYEAEMNLIMYGVEGEMQLTVKPDIIHLIITDKGPGIEDIDRAMQEGYSTATEKMREMGFGAGMGLPNIRKNSDEFSITSEIDKGTRLEITINSHS